MSFETRQRIISTATGLFTRQGYFNTSVRDIAKAAGLSTGAVYHHFPRKKEIASAITDSTRDFLVTEFESTIAKHSELKDQVFEIVHTMLRLADEKRDLMEYALHVKHREISPGGKPICLAEPFELLKKHFRRQMALGNIRKMDPHAAVVCLTAMPIRFMQMKWDGAISKKLISYTNDIYECVWRGMENS